MKIWIVILLLCLQALGQEFGDKIASEKAREQKAKTRIAKLDAEVSSLRATLATARDSSFVLEQTLYSKAGLQKSEAELQWSELDRFIHKIDSLYRMPPTESNLTWAEERWQLLKSLPVVKLSRSDTLVMQGEQGVLLLRKKLEELRAAEARERALAEQMARELAAKAAEPPPAPAPAPPPPAPIIVEPPPPPVVAEPPPPPPIPEKSTFDGKVYRVGKASDRKDGTLWEISAIVYGDPQKWQRLWRANKAHIKDPDHIVPGMVLVVPDRPVPKGK